ncbi:MAG: DNA-processing protein DprA [Anaerolineae bacterium]|nr:DNA-processing protein DprA [Anaerolineae bacterium]MDH7475305.1 DNA-processing protein DprA [Anaerolineae bacterium]
MTDLKYWVGFNIVPNIGPAKVQALLDHFGDLETAWRAHGQDLQAAGLDRRAVSSLLAARKQLDLDAELEKIARAGVRVLTWADADYPAPLRNIYHPPPVLYVKGELCPEDEWAVAVVGTRRATVYGKEAARVIAGDLARNGVTVVSGLARGIDAQAHKAALDAGGRTIAVLGCGVDLVYPPEHRKLAEAIVAQGALISEYALGTPPEGSNFPPRNRIISGLSLGVVIVEAGAGSGALITADYAAEQGREVFAVPGNIFNRSSEGCNALIRDGAHPVLSVNDILEVLNLTMVSQQAEVRAVVPENETEARLLTYITSEPIHVDELGRLSGLPIAQVSSTLALMELKGMVRQVGGMNYVLVREERADYIVD